MKIGCLVVLLVCFLPIHLFCGQKQIIMLPGESAGQFVHKAAESGVYTNRQILKTALNITGLSKKIMPGVYVFNENPGLFEVLRKVRKADLALVKFTVPEGFTKEEIAYLYKTKLFGKEEEFLGLAESENLEGRLFPETYFFYPGVPARAVCDTMAAEFRKRVGEIDPDTLILASIVEKEAKTSEDKKMVASVFINRLKKGWYLESCATVRYAKKKYKEKLTYKDLRVKSNFNTYLHPGLPPGPVCNPGLDSIEAVRYPAMTDSLFFVLDKESGMHQYSKYYAEHLKKQGVKVGRRKNHLDGR